MQLTLDATEIRFHAPKSRPKLQSTKRRVDMESRSLHGLRMNFSGGLRMSLFFALVHSLFVPTLGFSNPAAASRCWMPGAMVEVEIVQPVLQRTREGDEKMVDLVVEIVEVFTGSCELKGKEIQISPVMAFRFPPERWCAYGTESIYGASVDFFQPGRKGLLWIFERKELQTGWSRLSGQEFSFATGFLPVWDRSESVTHPNYKHFLKAWDETRSMMQVLKTLEGLDDIDKETAVLELVEDENPKVRKWALAALVRVHGVDVISILKSLETSEEITAETKDFSNRIGTPLSWQMFTNRERQRIPSVPLIGAEVLTEEKTEGRPTLFSKPEVIEPGTVKVLRVFNGTDFKEGDVLPVTSGHGKPGTKFLISPRNGEICLPSHESGRPWIFPPEGLWDGEFTLLSGARRPEVSLKPILPWLEKLSRQPTPYADEFLDEALSSAPLSVALWALRNYREHLRPETLAKLREASGVDDLSNVGTYSLRDKILYDAAMRIIYRELWEWDSQRVALLESILAHPLADEREAWLLYNINALEPHPSSGTSADWMRLAKAARNNASWRESWLDPLHRRMFDQMVWNYTWTESQSRFDAASSVDYLVERWSIQDRREPSEADFTDSRGGMLARSLPLNPDEVERLRVALALRLSSSGEPLTSGEIEQRVSQIRSMTWDKIRVIQLTLDATETM